MGTGENIVGDGPISVNNNRRLIYAFLSEMYEKEITVERLKELSDEDSSIMRIGTSAELGDAGLRKGFQMLTRYLRDMKGRDLNQVKLELAVEYANLFLGVKHKPAHPSESVYLSEAHVMFQGPRDAVQRVYWNAGVDKVKEFTEPEDHIAIELQFMAYLCRMTVEALEKSENEKAKKFLQIQKEFIDDHLSKWTPELTNDILDVSENDFYKGIAYITRSFVELERNSITDLLEEMK